AGVAAPDLRARRRPAVADRLAAEAAGPAPRQGRARDDRPLPRPPRGGLPRRGAREAWSARVEAAILPAEARAAQQRATLRAPPGRSARRRERPGALRPLGGERLSRPRLELGTVGELLARGAARCGRRPRRKLGFLGRRGEER